jgi:hypothetical protein
LVRDIQYCPVNFFSAGEDDISQLYRCVQLVLNHVNDWIVMLCFLHYHSLRTRENQENALLKIVSANTDAHVRKTFKRRCKNTLEMANAAQTSSVQFVIQP